jgi:thiopurine S-methyltransferase
MTLNKAYWENRYKEQHLGWDIGVVSPPIQQYINQLDSKTIKILIPGAGNGYEAAYLNRNGFNNVFVLDIAEQPLQEFSIKNPDFPKNHLIIGDFFDLELKDYDLVLEQTFFCALSPVKRPRYVLKMKELLKKGGKLAGLFFDFPLTEKGPPFGGSMKEYKELFKDHFNIKTLERSYNSINPRQGSELFFIFEK